MPLNYYLELDLLIARLLTLQLSLMRIWLPQRGKPLSNLSLSKRLVGSLIYLTVTRLYISYAVHQVRQYLFAPRSTYYAAILRILRYALSSMVFSTLLSLLLFSMYFLMLIRQEIPLITGPPLFIAFFLVLLWFLGEVRNKLIWPAPVLKQNIVPLLIPHLSSFGYDDFSKT